MNECAAQARDSRLPNPAFYDQRVTTKIVWRTSEAFNALGIDPLLSSSDAADGAYLAP
jgi:hypothetical protein